MTATKKCSTCFLDKELNCFGKSKQTKSGFKYSCKNCEAANRNAYDKERKEKVNEYKRIYYKKNKERYQKYRQSFQHHYSELKISAKKRNLSLDISYEKYVEFIKDKNCEYCNNKLPLVGHGLDRMDNNIGYIIENVVPCCTTCNFMKTDMNKNEFLEHCQLIVDKFRNSGN